MNTADSRVIAKSELFGLYKVIEGTKREYKFFMLATSYVAPGPAPQGHGPVYKVKLAFIIIQSGLNGHLARNCTE